MEWLKGKSEDLFSELLSMGLVFPRKSIELFANYLQTSAPTNCKICATQIGWYEDTFVLPTMVIGRQSDRIVFQGGQRQPQEYEQKGTLAQWQSEIAARAPGNPLLELAISVSFAGPLLQKCNGESGGVHLFGDSSTGKTTLLEVAASTWGGPSHKRSWRATVNGMEAAAMLSNDTLLVIDEVSQCNPREVGLIAYGLGNGISKQRAGRTGSARRVDHFKAAILSSGERSLVAAIKAGGDKALAGQKLRILDLPANRKFGAWDALQGFSNGAEFSDALKREASEHYGLAGPAFLERLTRDETDFAQRLSKIKEMPEFSPLNASGQEQRAATRFATFALAGELATEYRLVPWESGAATRAAAECFAMWRNFRGRGTDERQQIVSQLIGFIESHGDSRFSYASQSLLVHDRAGWIMDSDDEGRVFMFTAAGMNSALSGFDLRLALNELEELGVILPANADGERAKTANINGVRHRLYHVNYAKLLTYQVRE
jgi:putative DNA primase/helicase